MLTENQKELIKGSISYLLDFSSNPTELEKQIAEFKEALKNDVSETHNFYDYRKFLIHPEKILRLEESNDKDSPASTGEVQLHIIAIALEVIHEAASESRFKHLETEIKELIPHVIPKENYDKPFESEKLQLDTTLPWVNMHEEGQTYTYSLILYSDNTIKMEIRYKDPALSIFDPEVEEIKEYHNFGTLPENMDNSDAYQHLSSLCRRAMITAASIMKENLINFLLDEKYCDSETYDKLINNPNLLGFISNEFYLSQIINKKLSLEKIASLTLFQSYALLNPSLISFLKTSWRHFNIVTKLQPYQSDLASIYYPEIKERRIYLETFEYLTREQCHVLSHPVVSNLIGKDIIPFALAKLIPESALSVFSNAGYSDYFFKNKIDWIPFTRINPSLAKILCRKGVTKLINEGIVSFEDIINDVIMAESLITMCRPGINQLLVNKIITIKELPYIPLPLINSITKHPYCCDWLNARLLTIEEIRTDTDINNYAKVFSQRLLAIMQNEPLTLDGKADAINKITYEMSKCARYSKISVDELKTAITPLLLNKMSYEWRQRLMNTNLSHSERSLLNNFLKIMRISQVTHAPINEALAAIIEAASKSLDEFKNAYHNYTNGATPHLFSKVNSEYSTLCENIIALSTLSAPVAHSHTVRYSG